MDYSDIEVEFSTVLEGHQGEIIKKLAEINEKITELKSLSDKTGIPFQLNVFNDYETARWYIPSKFRRLYTEKGWKYFEAFDGFEYPDVYYDDRTGDDNWEFWRASSLTC